MIIVVNGMARSGSTVQYNLAARVMESRGPLRRAGFIYDFNKRRNRKKLYDLRNSRLWSIAKTHDAPLENCFYDDRVYVLFTHRDIRDIAASLKKKCNFSFNKIINTIDTMLDIESKVLRLPNVLVQPYDLIYVDLRSATREIADFLQVNIDDAALDFITSDLSIETSKTRLETRSQDPVVRVLSSLSGRFRIDRRTQMHADHISASAGRGGDWQKQFDRQQIAELETRFGFWLRERGYVQSCPSSE